MPYSLPISVALLIATLLFLIALAMASLRLYQPKTLYRVLELIALSGATLLNLGTLIYQLQKDSTWLLLNSHMEGLLLMLTVMGGAVIYVRVTERLKGFDLFALIFLCLLSLWCFCSSWWTFRPFMSLTVDNTWLIFHLASVYLAAIGATISAAAGGLYLFTQRQLQRRDNKAERLRMLSRLASLDSIEKTIIYSASFGFLWTSIALLSGLVLIYGHESINLIALLSPKVLLAVGLWAIYALVMHVRFAPSFRGKRAALLAITGFVIMIAVFGLAATLRYDNLENGEAATSQTSTLETTAAIGDDACIF